MKYFLVNLKYLILISIFALNINMMLSSSPIMAEQTKPYYLWKAGTGCPAACGLSGNWFSCIGEGNTCYIYVFCQCYITEG